MDRLTVLVRESAQNSWDARRPDVETVKYGIHLRRVSYRGAEHLRTLLNPEPGGSKLGIDALLSSPTFLQATVTDRGTRGLGGPLRADEVREGESGADFVGLLLNTGDSPPGRIRGGTYGFGKGVLFTSSIVSTIIVRTRCRTAHGLQTRLMGATLGTGFHHAGRGYTGRHFWGEVSSGLPMPLLDADADAIAEELGLSPMTAGETGTDVVILGLQPGSIPDVDGEAERVRSPEQVADHLASAMMWNLWPLMLTDDGPAALDCSITLDGESVSVPTPASEPHLRPFIDAYRQTRTEPVHLRRKSTRTDLGRFAAAAHLAPVGAGRVAVAAPFSGSAHHCAIMRGPRLVVGYLPGPELAEEMVHYGAVFVADPALEKTFADSEPPTHDDWVPEYLTDSDAKNIVNYTKRQIRAQLAAFADRASAPSAGGGEQPPLGALSGRLSALIPTATGPGADGLYGETGGGRGTPAKVRVITRPRMIRSGGSTLVIADIDLPTSHQAVTVTATAAVALDSGAESEPPAGAAVPKVIGFRSRDGHVLRGDTITVGPDDARRWTILVEPTEDAAVLVRVSAS